jgi:hypothetical protein
VKQLTIGQTRTDFVTMRVAGDSGFTDAIAELGAIPSHAERRAVWPFLSYAEASPSDSSMDTDVRFAEKLRFEGTPVRITSGLR